MSDPREFHDEQSQVAAETGEMTGPDAERYRHLYAALAHLDSPRPPSDFAATLERRIADEASADSFEKLERAGVRIGVVALFALALLAPAAAWLLRGNIHRLSYAPWPLLLAVAASLLALAWFDRKPSLVRSPAEKAA